MLLISPGRGGSHFNYASLRRRRLFIPQTCDVKADYCNYCYLIKLCVDDMSWNSRGTSFGPVLRNSMGTSFGPVPDAMHVPLLVGSQNDAAAEAPVSRHASPGVLPLPPRAQASVCNAPTPIFKWPTWTTIRACRHFRRHEGLSWGEALTRGWSQDGGRQ